MTNKIDKLARKIAIREDIKTWIIVLEALTGGKETWKEMAKKVIKSYREKKENDD